MGESATTSDAEIVAQLASASDVEDASKNSKMTAQIYPVYIHIAAIRGGGVIDCPVRHTPLLLLILAAAALAATMTTGYGIVSSYSSPSSSSLY